MARATWGRVLTKVIVVFALLNTTRFLIVRMHRCSRNGAEPAIVERDRSLERLRAVKVGTRTVGFVGDPNMRLRLQYPLTPAKLEPFDWQSVVVVWLEDTRGGFPGGFHEAYRLVSTCGAGIELYERREPE